MNELKVRDLENLQSAMGEYPQIKNFHIWMYLRLSGAADRDVPNAYDEVVTPGKFFKDYMRDKAYYETLIKELPLYDFSKWKESVDQRRRKEKWENKYYFDYGAIEGNDSSNPREYKIAAPNSAGKYARDYAEHLKVAAFFQLMDETSHDVVFAIIQSAEQRIRGEKEAREAARLQEREHMRLLGVEQEAARREKLARQRAEEAAEAERREQEERAKRPPEAEDLLALPVPEMTDERLAELVAELKPNDYSSISTFGTAYEIEAGRVINLFCDYMIRKGAKPAATVEAIEELMDHSRGIKANALIQNDPGWLARTFTKADTIKLRIGKPEDTPLYGILQKFKEMPAKAKEDLERYTTDTKVLDHARTIISAYYEVLGRIQGVLEQKKGDLLTEKVLFSANAGSVVEDRIGAIVTSRQSLMVQGLSFDELGAVTARTTSRLGNISTQSGNAQMAAVNAIRVHSLYQVRRLQQFGIAVDETVLKSFNLTKDAMVEVERAVPTHVQSQVTGLLDAVVSGLGGVKGDVMQDMSDFDRALQALQMRRATKVEAALGLPAKLGGGGAAIHHPASEPNLPGMP